jgi:chorismate dehydratase
MTTRLRVGLFPYLNVQPLVTGLENASDIEMTIDVPSRIASAFREGRLDAAMIPSFEAASMGALVHDSICIASDGPVETVLLHHRVPLARIETVALDEASRTSAALTKILIEDASGRAPRVSPTRASEASFADADAILLIGDPAFAFERAGYERLDLGEIWCRAHGLPFVFAVMVLSPAAASSSLPSRLVTSLRKGLDSASGIARSYNSGVDARRAERYLREVIRYDFGAREKEGLRLFYRLAREKGLLTDAKELRFHAI